MFMVVFWLYLIGYSWFYVIELTIQFAEAEATGKHFSTSLTPNKTAG